MAIKLKKRNGKTEFLDTVVFGIVFHKPNTKAGELQFKENVRKKLENIWGNLKKAYIIINQVELKSNNDNESSSMR